MKQSNTMQINVDQVHPANIPRPTATSNWTSTAPRTVHFAQVDTKKHVLDAAQSLPVSKELNDTANNNNLSPRKGITFKIDNTIIDQHLMLSTDDPITNLNNNTNAQANNNTSPTVIDKNNNVLVQISPRRQSLGHTATNIKVKVCRRPMRGLSSLDSNDLKKIEKSKRLDNLENNSATVAAVVSPSPHRHKDQPNHPYLRPASASMPFVQYIDDNKPKTSIRDKIKSKITAFISPTSQNARNDINSPKEKTPLSRGASLDPNRSKALEMGTEDSAHLSRSSSKSGKKLTHISIADFRASQPPNRDLIPSGGSPVALSRSTSKSGKKLVHVVELNPLVLDLYNLSSSDVSAIHDVDDLSTTTTNHEMATSLTTSTTSGVIKDTKTKLLNRLRSRKNINAPLDTAHDTDLEVKLSSIDRDIISPFTLKAKTSARSSAKDHDDSRASATSKGSSSPHFLAKANEHLSTTPEGSTPTRYSAKDQKLTSTAPNFVSPTVATSAASSQSQWPNFDGTASRNPDNRSSRSSLSPDVSVDQDRAHARDKDNSSSYTGPSYPSYLGARASSVKAILPSPIPPGHQPDNKTNPTDLSKIVSKIDSDLFATRSMNLNSLLTTSPNEKHSTRAKSSTRSARNRSKSRTRNTQLCYGPVAVYPQLDLDSNLASFCVYDNAVRREVADLFMMLDCLQKRLAYYAPSEIDLLFSWIDLFESFLDYITSLQSEVIYPWVEQQNIPIPENLSHISRRRVYEAIFYGLNQSKDIKMLIAGKSRKKHFEQLQSKLQAPFKNLIALLDAQHAHFVDVLSQQASGNVSNVTNSAFKKLEKDIRLFWSKKSNHQESCVPIIIRPMQLRDQDSWIKANVKGPSKFLVGAWRSNMDATHFSIAQDFESKIST